MERIGLHSTLAKPTALLLPSASQRSPSTALSLFSKAEDDLRILCTHALKHGVWRPLWLCDVAVALETRPLRFDWDRCLGKDRKHAWWTICTLALAHQLLGATINGTPVTDNSSRIPKWLLASVLKQWDRCQSPVMPRFLAHVRYCWGDAQTLREILKSRWPNAIQATLDCNGTFNEGKRWPYQIRHCGERAWKIITQPWTIPPNLVSMTPRAEAQSNARVDSK